MVVYFKGMYRPESFHRLVSILFRLFWACLINRNVHFYCWEYSIVVGNNLIFQGVGLLFWHFLSS